MASRVTTFMISCFCQVNPRPCSSPPQMDLQANGIVGAWLSLRYFAVLMEGELGTRSGTVFRHRWTKWSGLWQVLQMSQSKFTRGMGKATKGRQRREKCRQASGRFGFPPILEIAGEKSSRASFHRFGPCGSRVARSHQRYSFLDIAMSQLPPSTQWRLVAA
jgi:hypothetical protein